MANLIPFGINSDTGHNEGLDAGADTICSGTNDLANTPYAGGNIDIGTINDIGFVDVDAVNAKLDFTVSYPGTYKVSFRFSCLAQSGAGQSLSSLASFRLTDGVNNSTPICCGTSIPADVGFVNGDNSCVVAEHEFFFDTDGAKTVKLQKKNTLSTNISSREVLANADSGLSMSVYRVAD